MNDLFAPVIAAVALVLQRWDRRRDGHGTTDYRAVSMQLIELAQTWSWQAEQLRDAVREWSDSADDEDEDEDTIRFLRAIAEKQDSVDDFLNEYPDLDEFLKVYAPELADELVYLSERSAENLDKMIGEATAARRAGASELATYRQGFEQRTDEVVSAIDALREFVVVNFPLAGA